MAANQLAITTPEAKKNQGYSKYCLPNCCIFKLFIPLEE